MRCLQGLAKSLRNKKKENTKSSPTIQWKIQDFIEIKFQEILVSTSTQMFLLEEKFMFLLKGDVKFLGKKRDIL